jgi:hypothetical protein
MEITRRSFLQAATSAPLWLSASDAGAQSNLLPWQPPNISGARTIWVGSGATRIDLKNEAVVLRASAVRRGSLVCSGASTVTVMGGQALWDGSGGNASDMYVDASEAVHIEGRHIVCQSTGDAIWAGGTSRHKPPFTKFPTVTIQNCLIGGVTGAKAEIHADIFQLDFAVSTLRIARLTGSTDYQGFFLRPVSPVSRIELRDINLKFTGRSGTDRATLLYFFLNKDEASRAKHKIVMSNVYIEAPSGIDPLDLVSPKSGAKTAQDGQGPYIWWPELTQQIQDPSGAPARLRIGRPPGGDFVTAGQVGMGYVSPGYVR